MYYKQGNLKLPWLQMSIFGHAHIYNLERGQEEEQENEQH